MVKVDISLWDNKKRLGMRLRSLATMVMSICAVNGMYMFYQKVWLLFGINVFFFISTIPLFVSYSRWSKLPPKYEGVENV